MSRQAVDRPAIIEAPCQRCGADVRHIPRIEARSVVVDARPDPRGTVTIVDLPDGPCALVHRVGLDVIIGERWRIHDHAGQERDAA